LQGYFVRPTIITEVKDDDAIMQEEVFGPVVCVVPFDSEDEVNQQFSSYFIASWKTHENYNGC
jgi:acyl-CoA reductase-like NAD-dependent aldehyde dehydrogenase